MTGRPDCSMLRTVAALPAPGSNDELSRLRLAGHSSFAVGVSPRARPQAVQRRPAAPLSRVRLARMGTPDRASARGRRDLRRLGGDRDRSRAARCRGSRPQSTRRDLAGPRTGGAVSEAAALGPASIVAIHEPRELEPAQPAHSAGGLRDAVARGNRRRHARVWRRSAQRRTGRRAAWAGRFAHAPGGLTAPPASPAPPALILSTILVVEWPGVTGMRTTRPPRVSTMSRPTMSSAAQSAPFTRMSG